MQLDPRVMSGAWDDGRTLDRHIRSSEFVGYNQYGHPQFDTTRTELGELLYRLKYRHDRSAISPIAEVTRDFVREWGLRVDVVVPVPPSKARAVQPVFQIADEVGRLLALPVDRNSVRKTKATPELKNLEHTQRIEILAGAHLIESDSLRGQRILLLDDLYQSGATMNAIAGLLKGPGGASAVFALGLTRARS